ncbi:MAG: hypothetical protein HYU87_02860 [Chloroflexi bacterium]|nr:hypothetical protein [Chloroflexota bacterium]
MIRSLAAPRLGPTPRMAVAVAALLLATASAVTVAVPPPAQTATPTPALSERLGPRTWALAIPVAWLSAPIPGLRDDDVLDLLGARPSERATASDVAAGVRVMAVDERTLVVELTAEDASAIASARARGLALIPILRSTR